MDSRTEPMSDERLAEIRAAWADGGALNRTGQEVRALLAEVDRLRLLLDRAATYRAQAERELWREQRAVKRITADDFAEKIVSWLTEDECWGPTNALDLDFDGTAQHLLAKIRAEVSQAARGEF